MDKDRAVMNPIKCVEGRVVEPFQIQFDGAMPLANAKNVDANSFYASSSAIPVSASAYAPLNPSQEMQNNAKLESMILNETIRQSVRDGKLINLEEEKTSAALNIAGQEAKRLSAEERRRVVLSGMYENVEDCTIRSDLNTNYIMGGQGAHPTVDETVKPTDTFSEYKSEYGEEGYKISEYKSMY